MSITKCLRWNSLLGPFCACQNIISFLPSSENYSQDRLRVQICKVPLLHQWGTIFFTVPPTSLHYEPRAVIFGKNNHEMLYFGSRFLCQFSSNTWILFALRIKVLLQQLNSTCSTTSKDVSSRYESFICLFGHEDWSWTFVVKHQREVKRYLLALIRILPPQNNSKNKGKNLITWLERRFCPCG